MMKEVAADFDFEAGSEIEYYFVPGSLADLILNGKNSGELPVEIAEDHLLIILKTTAAMGLTIDGNIVWQAHAVSRPE
ncbi:MAG: hypothetical protein KKB30_05045 [Proteobacteria bacterium]|nr:hypothetical protein [Pseudomonadota bacterium]MBU1714583.1 hypothetical protein [Pseudomonadota bacterium]